MSYKHESAIWSRDSGQRITWFDRCHLNLTWYQKLISHFFVVKIIINWSCLPNDRYDRVKNLSDFLNKNQILIEDFSYFVRLVAFVLSSLVLLSWLLLDFLAKLARYSSVSQIPSLVESSWSCLEWLLLLGSPIYSLLTWIPPETCLLLDLLLFLG